MLRLHTAYRRALRTCAAAGCLVAAAVVPSLATTMASGVVQDAGVQMRWRYENRSTADDAGLGWLTLEFSDQASGTPLRYAPGQLAAWLQRQRPTLSEGELECVARVKSLVSSGIGRRADVDLNTYRILTLNSDQSLAFINPFVGLNNAKLESIVPLPGKPLAWAHVPERGHLWVLVDADPRRLVTIDTASRRIAATLDLPPGFDGDAQLAVERGADRPWLASRAAGRLAWLDASAGAPSWRGVPAHGVAALHLVATADGEQVFTTHTDGRLIRWSRAESGPPQALWQWALPHGARQLRFSGLAGRLVAHDEQAVLAIDPEGSEVRRLALGHPVLDLMVSGDGRHAFAVGGDRLSMVDLASGTVQARSATVAGARRLLLTARFLYAVAADESSANLWALADLRAGRVQPAQVLLGSAGAPTEGDASLRRAIVAPDGSGLLVANAADRLVYQYTEGMMAPVGSYSNYKRGALALELLDLAPREVAPGRYEVPVRYETGGMHHLMVSGVAPRFVGCDRVALALTAGQAQRDATPVLKVRLLEDGPVGGARRRIVVALEETASRAPPHAVTELTDLTLLLFDKHSGWQRRVHLREQRAGAGRYEAEVANVPAGTTYEMFVGSLSHELPFIQGRVRRSGEGAR